MSTATSTPISENAIRLSEVNQQMADQSREHKRINDKLTDGRGKLKLLEKQRSELEVQIADGEEGGSVTELNRCLNQITIAQSRINGLEQLLRDSQAKLDSVSVEWQKLNKIEARRKLQAEITDLTAGMEEMDRNILKEQEQLLALQGKREQLFEQRLELQHELGLGVTPERH